MLAVPTTYHTHYTETAVTFEGPPTREGLAVHQRRLAGILCEPASRVDSPPFLPASRVDSPPFLPFHCALLCHGFASNKNGFHLPALAHHLAQHLGLSSLRFDFAGNMDSPGPFRFGGFQQEVEQMAAAKSFLEEERGKLVVLLLGHSRGAINATLYTAQACAVCSVHQPQLPYPHLAQLPQLPNLPRLLPPTPTSPKRPQSPDPFLKPSQQRLPHDQDLIIPLVVLVAGRYDLTLNMHQRYGADVLQQLQATGPWQQRTRRDGDGQEIQFEVTAQEMAERFSLDVAGACATISKTMEPAKPKVLVLHGQADPICEASDAARLARHIAGAQLVEAAGADHWWKGQQQQLLELVSEFVVRAGREKLLCR